MALVTISDLLSPAGPLEPLLEKAEELSSKYDHWIENHPGDGHERAPGIHASELNCGRRVVYSILNTEKKNRINKNFRQRFEMGKYVHLMLQRDFAVMASESGGLMHFEPEVRVSPEYQELAAALNLHSSCDGVFTFRDTPGGEPTLRVALEIKTEAPDQYDKLNEPKPDHVRQAHLYMAALDVPLMWFLYFNKGNQNNTPSRGAFLVRFHLETWKEIERECDQHLNTAEKFSATNELPERKEAIHCTWCPYAWTCKPTYLEKRNQRRWSPLRGT